MRGDGWWSGARIDGVCVKGARGEMVRGVMGGGERVRSVLCVCVEGLRV